MKLALSGILAAVLMAGCSSTPGGAAAGAADAGGGEASPPGPEAGGGSDGGGGHDGGSGSDGGGGSDGGSGSDGGGGSDGEGGSGDAASGTEGGTATSCGGQRCQSGQTCVGGACTFAGCTGARVPGDYATPQDAVDALSALGGTICIGAGPFGDLSVAPTAPMTIQGLSAAQTTLGRVTLAPAAALTVRGVGVLNMTIGSSGANGTVAVSACSVSRGVTVSEGSDTHGAVFDTVTTIDACDISGGGESGPTSTTAVSVSGERALVTLTLTNSYVHDCEDGVSTGSFGTGGTSMTLVNDTIERAGTALLLAGAVSVFDDIIANNGYGISLYVGNDASLQRFGNNLLFGNTTNYEGSAVDGPGYVKADPLLDTSAPPVPLAGSPCRGAGDPASATATDFWGAPRGSHPDIGAVQAP